MIFASPFFWWGLLALSVPIIIHLFVFRRTKKIYFSNVSLINLVRDETKSRSRLRHLLILACRLLFFAFLILAFLLPSLPSEKILRSKSILYIDNSYSLSGEVSPGITGLDEILTSVNAYVRRQSLDHQFVILTNDFEPFSNHFKSKNETLDYLTEIGFSARSRSAGAILDRLNQYEVTEVNRILFSDFQRSTFGELDAVDWAEVTGELFLGLVDGGVAGNVHVDSVYLFNPFVNLGEKNTLTFDVKYSGRGDVKDLNVRLLNGDKLLGSQAVQILPGASIEVNFEIDPQELISNRLMLSFEDFPVTFDNDFSLAIEQSQAIRIAIITPKQQSYLPTVYGNEALFDADVYDPNAIDFSQLTQYDLILLEEVSEVPNWLRGRLSELGDLVMIPSSTITDPSSLSRLFQQQVSLASDSALRNLELRNLEHPFFQGLIDVDSRNVAMPKVRSVVSYRSSVNSLLVNEFGVPYLTAFDLGANTYLFGSPIDRSFTNLPEHSLFVPMMYKIAQLSAQAIGVRAYTADDRLITITSRRPWTSESVILENDVSQFIPNHYYTQDRLVLEMPPEGFAGGFYAVSQGSDTITTLAFNPSKLESDLSAYTFQELEEMAQQYPEVSLLSNQESQNVASVFSDYNEDTPYWKYALILALVFALLEVILVRIAHQKS
ncbi:MAG: BatA domain-containing protein [Bacteroidota bacterium]